MVDIVAYSHVDWLSIRCGCEIIGHQEGLGEANSVG